VIDAWLWRRQDGYRQSRDRSVTRLGTRTFESRRAHPTAWFAFDATLDVILTAALWWTVGRTVALVVGCLLGLLLVSGLLLRRVERRSMPRPGSRYREEMEEVFAARREGDVSRLVQLMQSQEHSDDFIRAFATRSLGALGNPLAVDPLIAVLDDPSFDVRVAAILSLGKIGDQQAVQPLATRLGQATDDAEIVALLKALRTLGGKPAPEDTERIAGNPNPRVRRALSRVTN
jgi:hypothetical protein